MPSASCTKHMPAPPSASVGQLKPRALASHNVHRVSVRWIYYILDELRIFSRTFCFDPFMSEVGVDALLFLQGTFRCEQQPNTEARPLASQG